MDVPAGTLSKVSYDSLALGFRRRMYAKKKDQTEIYQFDPFFVTMKFVVQISWMGMKYSYFFTDFCSSIFMKYPATTERA